MPKDRPDYITVRLSDKALAKLGADAAVGVNSGRMHYMFHGAAPVEVLRRPEWEMLRHDKFDGGPLFQEAEAETATLAAVEPHVAAVPPTVDTDATHHSSEE